jgi:hypothetical protein
VGGHVPLTENGNQSVCAHICGTHIPPIAANCRSVEPNSFNLPVTHVCVQ